MHSAWLAFINRSDDGSVYAQKARAPCKTITRADIQHVLNRYQYFYPNFQCLCVNEDDDLDVTNLDIIYVFPRGILIINHLRRTFEWFDPNIRYPLPSIVQGLVNESYTGVVSTKRTKQLPLSFVHATIVHHQGLSDFLQESKTLKLSQWFDLVRYPSPEYLFRLAAWDMLGKVIPGNVKWPTICKMLADGETDTDYTTYLDNQLIRLDNASVTLDPKIAKRLIRDVYVPIAHAVSKVHAFRSDMRVADFIQVCKSGSLGTRLMLAHLLRNSVEQ